MLSGSYSFIRAHIHFYASVQRLVCSRDAEEKHVSYSFSNPFQDSKRNGKKKLLQLCGDYAFG